MQNVNVTTSVTTVVAAGDRQGTLTVQNQSDTTMYIAIGDLNAASLTASLGLILNVGDSLSLSPPQSTLKVSAIHGGSGNKVAHWQHT